MLFVVVVFAFCCSVFVLMTKVYTKATRWRNWLTVVDYIVTLSLAWFCDVGKA